METYRVTLTIPETLRRTNVAAVHLIISHTPGVRAVNRFGHLGHPMPVCDWHAQYVVEFRHGGTNTAAGGYIPTESDAYEKIADWEAGLIRKQPYLIRSESGSAIGK